MYNLKITNEDISENTWGAFSVYKTFTVTHPSIPKSQIKGYVIQKVSKKTHARKLENGQIVPINNIEVFTNGNTLYMNHEYYEIFNINRGESTSADVFQNGAVLRYHNDGYADDDPPTSGYIYMRGEACFIPADNLTRRVDLFGFNWSYSKDTPANGLGYRVGEDTYRLFERAPSNIVIHKVVVYWNGIRKELSIPRSLVSLTERSQIEYNPASRVKTRIYNKHLPSK